jgi:hypothetical protein
MQGRLSQPQYDINVIAYRVTSPDFGDKNRADWLEIVKDRDKLRPDMRRFLPRKIQEFAGRQRDAAGRAARKAERRVEMCQRYDEMSSSLTT